ncbi:endonuclease domain-containing protein [Streptomyces sp. NBC_00623]|uniref:endonuclease domain-containing protein n=1 Tax=unclassified Streptomyces TaxID=2593676 RepID=UPI00386B40EB
MIAETRPSGNVVLDHCYASGLVRGLLCTLCGYVHEFRLWSTSCGRVPPGYANRTRLRRNSNPARPNIWRLSILIRLT